MKYSVEEIEWLQKLCLKKIAKFSMEIDDMKSMKNEIAKREVWRAFKNIHENIDRFHQLQKVKDKIFDKDD